MPTDASSEIPLLSRLDAALLRRAAAGIATRAGEYGDLFLEDLRHAEVRLDATGSVTVVVGGGDGAAARLLGAGGQRHAAANGLDQDDIARLARRLGEPGAGRPDAPGATKERPGGRERAGDGTTSFPDPASVEALTLYLRRLADAVAAIPRLQRAGDDPAARFRLRGETRVQRVVIANSEGDVVEDRRAWARFAVRLAAVGRGGRPLEAAAGGGARDPERLASLLAPAAVAEDLARALDDADHAAPAPSGPMPVVLGPGVGGILFHEACGHGLEGDRALSGRSAFASLLGETVGPTMLTLVDDPTLDGLPGSRRIDDEGWAAAPLVLVDAGRVAGLMLDRATALRARTAPSGSARRESWRDLPLPRMTNTFVREGPYDPEEIVGSLTRGLYVAELGKGQVDTASAEFSFEVRRGHLIAGGRLVAPAGRCRIVGNGVRAVEGVRMIGSDLRFDAGSGECGKEGQRARAAVGQPTLLVDNLTVVSDAT